MSSPPRRVFPADGLLLDASALFRFHKCDQLLSLGKLTRLFAAAQVCVEFQRGGPAARAGLQQLHVKRLPVVPGSPEWTELALLRGSAHAQRDLGEDESIALAACRARQGAFLPFATFDVDAAAGARQREVVALDFVDTLAWLVFCGCLTGDAANALEDCARRRNGWRRPDGYDGINARVVEERVSLSRDRLQRWKDASLGTSGSRVSRRKGSG